MAHQRGPDVGATGHGDQRIIRDTGAVPERHDPIGHVGRLGRRFHQRGHSAREGGREISQQQQDRPVPRVR